MPSMTIPPNVRYSGSDPSQAGDRYSFLTRQPEPSALVLNEPGCYHIRILDSPPGY
jgi:hypothetical protein